MGSKAIELHHVVIILGLFFVVILCIVFLGFLLATAATRRGRPNVAVPINLLDFENLGNGGSISDKKWLFSFQKNSKGYVLVSTEDLEAGLEENTKYSRLYDWDKA